MSAPTIARPATAEDRIANLFLAGHGLDFVSERGVSGGWTRADAIRVASTRGWTLDSDGKIPGAAPRPSPIPGPGPRPQPPAQAPTAADPRQQPIPELIARGKRHRTAAVRRAADRAAAVRDREVQAARAQLEQLEAEARRLRSVITGRKPNAQKASPAGRYGPCKRCGAPNGGRGVPNHRDTCKAEQ